MLGVFELDHIVGPPRATGVIMSQLLPSADNHVLKLFADFERGVYQAVTPA